MNTNTSPIRTTCPYCGVGCGVLATPRGPEAAEIAGDPEHPSNFGRLCSKGAALGETLSLKTRLLYPEIRGRRAGWDEALNTVAGEFRRIIDQHGPDAVAFYVSGQLLTEDYYVANKLMKGFIGSANIDTNSRLCMSSTVAGHNRAFGEDIVPGCYEDLELCDLLVLVGSNTAWCHPVLFQRILKAKLARPNLKIVCIDPRGTATSQAADLHLPVRPGTDVILFNGLLHALRQRDALNLGFLEKHVAGFTDALETARASAPSIPAVAAACGLAETDVARFYQWFAATEKTVTAWSQGVNQSSSGTDKVNAIINVHLATGRIGRPGMGPLSLTGQPNAMGGREVGGLANQLAAHLSLDNPGHRELVRGFWNAPTIAKRPGLKAVDLFRAIGEGQVKAVWIMATNPVVSLPDANAVRAALSGCEFVAVSDCEKHTDLAPYAHVSLPAAAWGEKNGTVTNSERRISRQRPFLPCPGEAQPDWWIISEVARRMGHGDAFTYQSACDIFVEHARLSEFANRGERLFDISGLADLDDHGYDGLDPIQWPVNATNPQGTARLFEAGGFSAPERRARMLSLAPQAPAERPDETFLLVLNTGRIRDQWHTMTRTGKTARLTAHAPEPFVELHPGDAARFAITDGGLARVSSRYGETLARARITDEQQPGSVFMPMHWSGPFSSQGLANGLVNPVVDPISGEPESKHTPVRVEAWSPAWQGFLLVRDPAAAPQAEYRVSIPGHGHTRYELAGMDVANNWRESAATMLTDSLGPRKTADAWLEFADPKAGRYRCAVVRDDRLEACVFISAADDLPARDWLASLFLEETLPDNARAALLSGQPPRGADVQGRILCSCFQVGEETLRRTIAAQGLVNTDQVGAVLKAGTGCGSCLAEIRGLLAEETNGSALGKAVPNGRR